MTFTKQLPIRTILILISIFATGCTIKHVALDSKYEPLNKNDVLPSFQPQIRMIKDIRKDKSNLGSLGPTKISNESIVEWLKNALIYHGFKTNYQKSMTSKIQAQDCTVDISLKMAYIRSYSTSKATNIVLALNFIHSEKLKYYRGSHAEINWNSSKSEINDSFTMALERALKVIKTDLRKLCSGSQIYN